MSIEDTTGNRKPANQFQRKRQALEKAASELPRPQPPMGLGDMVEKVIHAILPKAWLPKAGGGCGCGARKKALNEWMPGKG